jgi:hypothetical protein
MARSHHRKTRAERRRQPRRTAASAGRITAEPSTAIAAAPVAVDRSPAVVVAAPLLAPRPRQYGQRFGAMIGLYAGAGLVAMLVTLVPRLEGDERTLSGFGGGARLAALPGPAPTLAPPPSLGDDPRQVLLAAVAAQESKRGWRARQAVTTGGSSFVQTLSYVSPDRYRVFQPGISEALVVGEQGWLRVGAEWGESPNAVRVAHTAMRSVRQIGQLDEALAQDLPIGRLADEWQTGERLRVYRFQVPSAVEGEPPTEVTWWLRDSDGLPLRQRQHTHRLVGDATVDLSFEYGAPQILPPPAAAVLPAATPRPVGALPFFEEAAPDNPAPRYTPAAPTPGAPAP